MSGKAILRVRTIGPSEVEHIVSFLYALNEAYVCLYRFHRLIETAVGYSKKGIPFSVIDILNGKNASVILPGNRLVLRSVTISSPGGWEFLGSLNPLETLRKYYQDKHERKKDAAYRAALEADEHSLRNEALRNKVIAEQIKMLKSLGVSDEDIREVALQLFKRPLNRLDIEADHQVMEDVSVELIESQPEVGE